MWKGERERGKERQAKVEIQVRDIDVLGGERQRGRKGRRERCGRERGRGEKKDKLR